MSENITNEPIKCMTLTSYACNLL